MAEVKLRGVKKSFDEVEVIHGVDLEIKDQEFVVFVGPSGCGKSTLLRMIAGLEDITAGEIYIGDTYVNDLHPADRGAAMVFQSYALYPHMSVRENIGFGLKLNKVPKAEIQHKVAEAAKILKIKELLDRRPAQLSGGQRQRVAIGRTIVREPSVFLFDEPLSNLDAALRVQMRMELEKLHANLKTTMIYVTHDQVEAMTMADRIFILNDGYVEQVGTPLELYRKPANIFVAGFIGSPKMNLLSVRVLQIEGQQITLQLPGEDQMQLQRENINFKVGDTLTLGIRPEHFELEQNKGCSLSATVDIIERLGNETYIYANDANENLLTVVGDGELDVSNKEKLEIHFTTDHCHLFGRDDQSIQ